MSVLLPRRIIQITTTCGGEGNDVDCLYALCDDGSLWVMINSSESGATWEALTAIPQESTRSTPGGAR